MNVAFLIVFTVCLAVTVWAITVQYFVNYSGGVVDNKKVLVFARNAFTVGPLISGFLFGMLLLSILQ